MAHATRSPDLWPDAAGAYYIKPVTSCGGNHLQRSITSNTGAMIHNRMFHSEIPLRQFEWVQVPGGIFLCDNMRVPATHATTLAVNVHVLATYANVNPSSFTGVNTRGAFRP